VFLEFFIMSSLSSVAPLATPNLTSTDSDFYNFPLDPQDPSGDAHTAKSGADIVGEELKNAVPKMVCKDLGFLGTLWEGVGSIWNEVNSMWSGEKTPPPEPLCRVDGPAKQPMPINQRVPLGDASEHGPDILLADASGAAGGGGVVSDAGPGTSTPEVSRFNVSPWKWPMPRQAPLSWTGLGTPTHIGLPGVVQNNGVILGVAGLPSFISNVLFAAVKEVPSHPALRQEPSPPPVAQIDSALSAYVNAVQADARNAAEWVRGLGINNKPITPIPRGNTRDPGQPTFNALAENQIIPIAEKNPGSLSIDQLTLLQRNPGWIRPSSSFIAGAAGPTFADLAGVLTKYPGLIP
jgi:hypothetical protein